MTRIRCAFRLRECGHLDYAATWAGFADTFIARAASGGIPASEAINQVIPGARKAVELHDCDGEIFVSQSVWRGYVDEPKTPERMAPVPVVAQLAARLDAFCAMQGSPERGWMFPNNVRKPLCTAKLVREVIRSTLEKAGLECGTAGTPSGAAWPPIAIVWEWRTR